MYANTQFTTYLNESNSLDNKMLCTLKNRKDIYGDKK